MLEVADLMTELYTLLEKMQYLKPSSIAYAPHFSSAATNITLTTTILKLSPIAIKFLQILPYVQKTPGPMYGFRDELVMSATNWRAWRYNNELLLSTAFADMRDPDVLIRSRDPWYSDMISKEEIDIMLEEGGGVLTDPMMKILKPWQVAITGVDRIYTRQTNDTILMGGTMILDLKTRNLFTVGVGAVAAQDYYDGSHEDRGSIDPVTRGLLAPGVSEVMNIDARAKIEMYASRPATEALRDYIERFRSLEWVPGFVENDRMVAYPRDAYREMYITHGWPHKFDGRAFDEARIAWDRENRAKWRAAEPIRQLQEFEKRHQDNLEVIQYWKNDLEQLQSLNPDVKTKLYDPKKKAYNGRTRDQIIGAIEHSSKIAAEQEGKLPEMRQAADNVSDEVKGWRDLYREKYGLDYNLEFV